MKICYDELEKHQIKLSKNGNFRFWSGSQWKTIYYHESCENCGHPYLSGKLKDFVVNLVQILLQWKILLKDVENLSKTVKNQN